MKEGPAVMSANQDKIGESATDVDAENEALLGDVSGLQHVFLFATLAFFLD